MKTNAYFPAVTHWTLVCHAGDPHHPRARQALEELLQLYLDPIYAFIRRSGHSREDAEDLVQGFFAQMIERGAFATATPTNGEGSPRRFRTYVLACLKNFLCSAHRHAAADKRGLIKNTFSRDRDDLTPEQRYAAEPVDDLTPDKLFDRSIALELYRDVLKELETEAAAEGMADRFAAICRFLGQDADIETYRDLAAQTGVTVNTLKSDRHRFAKRARQIRWDKVRELVDNADEVEAEIIALEDALLAKSGVSTG